MEAMANIAETLGILITMDMNMQAILYLDSHCANVRERRKKEKEQAAQQAALQGGR